MAEQEGFMPTVLEGDWGSENGLGDEEFDSVDDEIAGGDAGIELPLEGGTQPDKEITEDSEFYPSTEGDDLGAPVDGISDEEEDFLLASSNAGVISPDGEIIVQDASDNGSDEGHFELMYVDIDHIALTHRIRDSHSVDALASSIRSTGLLAPPVVAPLQAEGYFVLIKGLRRILACAKTGIKRIPCIVNNKINTTEIPIVEAMYNHCTPYTVKEMVKYIEYLEKERGIYSPSMIEFLLQMDTGDYTKLKDILNDNDDDIVSKMMNGQLSIQMAFKALEKRRKNESREEKDLKKAEGVYSNTEESGASQLEGSGEVGDDEVALTEEEIKELAISASELDDADSSDLEALVAEADSIEGYQPNKQNPKERKPLDPALRKSVLARDKNTCRICEMGGQEYIDCLDVHHITEVYLGGDDSMENLITADLCCHRMIHKFARGELHIRPLEEMTEEEAKKFTRIVQLGMVIRKQMAKRGMKKEELKKVDDADTIGRTKPGQPQIAG